MSFVADPCLDPVCGRGVADPRSAWSARAVKLLETSVAAEPTAIATALKRHAGRLRRAGPEAGASSPWLHPELLAVPSPRCLETRHVRAAMSAQRNKTDAKDALGLAHIMRTGWFRQAHTKTESCYRIRLLLVQRRNLKCKFLDLGNTVQHSLKVFGIRLGKIGQAGFEQAVLDAVFGDAMTVGLMNACCGRETHCGRNILSSTSWSCSSPYRTICVAASWRSGVGPITSLSFVIAIDDPARFKGSLMSPRTLA